MRYSLNIFLAVLLICGTAGAINNAEVLDVAEANADTLHEILDHLHGISLCYPSLDDGVTITGGAGAWALFDTVQIIPINTIKSDFSIHFASIEAMSGNDVYELHLLYGAAYDTLSFVRFSKTAVQEATNNVPVQGVVVPANSAVYGTLATKGGGSDTVDISLFYHAH